MTRFPIRLVGTATAAAVVACLAVHAVVRPLASTAVNRVNEIRDYYTLTSKPALAAAEKQRAILHGLEAALSSTSPAPGRNGASYDFLQEFLKKHDIHAHKIAGGAGEVVKGMVVNKFEIRFDGTYHKIGELVSDLENGPFVCSVVSVRAVTKSAASNLVAVEMTVAFYRKAV